MAYDRARRILKDHRDQLDYAAEILLRRETIEREQFVELLEGKSEEEVFADELSPGRRPTQQARRRRRAGLPVGSHREGRHAPARA